MNFIWPFTVADQIVNFYEIRVEAENYTRYYGYT